MPDFQQPRPDLLTEPSSSDAQSPANETESSFDKGDRVRVLSGAFADRTGVVQELDGRGGARVMLGLLAMWIPIADLVAVTDGKDRPSMSTSHRKPSPAR